MDNKKKVLCGLMAFVISFICPSFEYNCNKPVNAVQANLFTSTFESSDDDWVSRGAAKVNVSSDASYTGSRSLYVCSRTSSWNGAALSLGSEKFIPGKSYSFTAMVMYETGSESEKIDMTMQYTGADGKVIYDHMAETETEASRWSDISCKNYMIPEDASDVVLYFETPENTIDFYIDDVCGMEAGGSTAETSGTLYGDVNNDGIINIIDLIQMKNAILCDTQKEFSPAADVDASGSVTAADVVLLRNYILGMTDSFPASTSKPDEGSTTSQEPVETQPAGEDEYDKNYKENVSADTLKMYQDSLLQVGNTARILDKIKNAKAGKEVTIGYIGGSITEGFSAGASLCYAKRSYEYFADQYGTGSNVKYINAGLSGTSSVLGNMRAERDLLSGHPDIIFIEYSVNDQGSVTYQKSFESLVKKCLMQENDPAVIILITRSQTGNSCQKQMAAVAKNYNLAAISVDNALTNALNSGKMTWSDYGNDQFHPHVAGHQLVADFIGYYYRQAQLSKNRSTSYTIPQTTVYGDEYWTASMVSSSELENFSSGSFKKGTSFSNFADGWTHIKNSNEPMKFTAEGKGIFILFKSNQGSSLGTLSVNVNGNKSRVSGNKLYAWGGPDADIAYIQDTKGELDVSLTMENASDDFEILGIGVIK